MRKLTYLAATGLALVALPASAAIVGTDLGSGGIGGSRTAVVGGKAMTFADRTCQAAIPNFTFVPKVDLVCSGAATDDMTFSAAFEKRTTPGGGWATWSGGYSGPVFFTGSGIGSATRTLTMPGGAGALDAFEFYLEPNSFSTFTFQVVATPSSGPTTTLSLPATGLSGARGWGFHTTAGETVTSVTINDVSGGAIGWSIAEFGFHLAGATPTPPPPPTGGTCDLTDVKRELGLLESKADAAAVARADIKREVRLIESKLDALNAGLGDLGARICVAIDLLLTPQGQGCTDGTGCGFGQFPAGLDGVPTPTTCDPYVGGTKFAPDAPAAGGLEGLVNETLGFYRRSGSNPEAIAHAEALLREAAQAKAQGDLDGASRLYRDAYRSLTSLSDSLQ